MSAINSFDKFLMCSPFIGCMVASSKQKSVDLFIKNVKDLKTAEENLEIRNDILKLSLGSMTSDEVKAETDAISYINHDLENRFVEFKKDFKSTKEFNIEVYKYAAISSIITVAIIVAAVAALAFTGYLSLPLAVGAGLLGLCYLACAASYALTTYRSNQVALLG
jgi:hypothetical protein